MGSTRIPAGYATTTATPSAAAAAAAANYQYRMPGTTPMNELDNFSTLGTMRHHPSSATQTAVDPSYYDPKQMKQKLLSVNVPESCV